MHVIESTKLTMFDVDDTLIKWGKSDHPNAIPLHYGVQDGTKYLPHAIHIEQLKDHKRRGFTIVVWSKGGAEWAENAVISLGLEPYVDYCMAKPDWIYDDQQPEKFMPKAGFTEDPTWKEAE